MPSMEISDELAFELKRKSLHVIAGTVGLATLFYLGIPAFRHLVAFSFASGLILSLLMKQLSNPVLVFIVDNFEREENRNFPLKDTLAFVLALGISSFLVDKTGLYATIILLAYGDTVSNIAGRVVGRTTNPLNHKKEIEGGLTAILASTILLSLFLNPLRALIISTVAMIFESLELKILGLEIDDNLTVPVSTIVTYIATKGIF